MKLLRLPDLGEFKIKCCHKFLRQMELKTGEETLSWRLDGRRTPGMSIQISNRQESIKEPAEGQPQTSDKEAVNSPEDQGNTSDEMTRDRR